MSVLAEIIALAQQQYGLVPRSNWQELLRSALAAEARAQRLSERQLALGCARDPALLASLVGALTVTESYFFRQPAHFAKIVDAARGVLARPGRCFSVWSAGCAMGEEAYSIALALMDAAPPLDLARTSIFGTDANPRAIAAAEAGIYTRWAFRGPLPTLSVGRFRVGANEHWELDADVRRRVAFRHASLQQQLAELPAGRLDAVFFRNVSVYLTQHTVAELYRGFARVLAPEGLLFIAATDVRPQLPEFEAWHAHDTTVFRRRSAAAGGSLASQAAEFGGTFSSGSEVPQRALCLVPDRQRQPGGSGTVRSAPSHGWSSADELADRGDLDGALSVIADRLARGEDPRGAYERRGSLHLALGQSTAAVDDFRRVLFFDPEDLGARYWYALALRQAGHLEAARRQLGLILVTPAADKDLCATAQALIGEISDRDRRADS